jgi:hypothetical protein
MQTAGVHVYAVVIMHRSMLSTTYVNIAQLSYMHRYIVGVHSPGLVTLIHACEVSFVAMFNRATGICLL